MLLGRICISALFLFFGIASIYYWEIVFTDLDTALVGHTMAKHKVEFIGSIWDTLSENVWYVLVSGIALQLIGGICILFGVYKRIGAALLIFYFSVHTCIFFPFWIHEGEQASYMLVMFLKNVAIIGGLFLLLRRGAGGSMYEVIQEEL